MNERQVIVYKDTYAMNSAVAYRAVLEMGDVIARRGRVDVALTGGRDSVDIYLKMASFPQKDLLDWSKVHLWWSDERFVSAEDGERNSLQARQCFDKDVFSEGNALAEEHIHEMPADPRTPEQVAAATDEENEEYLIRAAQSYQDEIIKEIGPDGHMDLAVFGVGPDGHYASLFPDRPEVLITDESKLVVGVSHSPKLPPLRLTMTNPFIRRTPKVWLFTSTKEKARAVSQALAGVDNPHVPSSFARGTEQTLWLLDKDAAGELRHV